MERAWAIASILCLFVAAILLLRENQDAAFVTATLGVVAWFLGYRVRLRGRTAAAETTDDKDTEADVPDQQ